MINWWCRHLFLTTTWTPITLGVEYTHNTMQCSGKWDLAGHSHCCTDCTQSFHRGQCNICWNYSMFSLLHASYISVKLKSHVHGQWMLKITQLDRWNPSDMDFPVWNSQCCLIAAESTHLLQIYLRESRALDLSVDLVGFGVFFVFFMNNN